MKDIGEVRFDRLGLYYIEPTHWNDKEQALGLASLLAHYLAPNPGQAWFSQKMGEWEQATEESIGSIRSSLEHMVHIWSGGEGASYQVFQEKGCCAIFLDAERFRSCAQNEEGLPDQFYFGFQVNWTPLGGTVCLTPLLHVSSAWPESREWAPEAPSGASVESLSAEEAALLLYNAFRKRIKDEFTRIKRHFGLGLASHDFGHGQLLPLRLFFASPMVRQQDAGSYLQGEYLRALGIVTSLILGTPDIKSTEITGGVMEGCLVTIAHCKSDINESYLMIPMSGHTEEHIEEKVHYLTGRLNYLDLDATQDSYDIYRRLEGGKNFPALWHGTLSDGIKLNITLFTLLRNRNPKVNERMFTLAHIMSSFLAKLRLRANADGRALIELKDEFDRLLRESRKFAQEQLTVTRIPGYEMMDICDGYTRAFRETMDTVKSAAEAGAGLTLDIEHFSSSVSQTAEMEAQKVRRDEEAGTKRLNKVLVLVALLAAIPLIVGEFSTSILARDIGWFPFFMGSYVSFGFALIAVLLVGYALLVSSWKAWTKRPAKIKDSILRWFGKRPNAVKSFYHLSENLLERYCAFGHENCTKSWHRIVKSTDDDQRQQSRDEIERQQARDEIERQQARERMHKLDIKMAEAVSEAMEQGRIWAVPFDTIPETDKQWAGYLEKKVCRFVLLGDVYDLRPENLLLPLTLCLYRFKYAVSELSSSTIPDYEWNGVMNSYGYTDEEIEAIETWAAQQDSVRKMEPREFLQACVDVGITALHELNLPSHQVTSL